MKFEQIIRKFGVGPRLVIGFTLVMLITSTLGIISLYNIFTLSELTQSLYDHPLIVGYNIREIESGVLILERDLRVMLHSEDPKELQTLFKRSSLKEQEVLDRFEVVLSNYLGDKTGILETKATFIHWGELRREIYSLLRQGDREAALALFMGDDKVLVEYFIEQAESIKTFAFANANNFLQQAQEQRDQAFRLNISILIGLLVFVLLIAWSLIRSLTQPLKVMTDWIAEIEAGNLKFKKTQSTDELGMLVGAINSLVHFQRRSLKESAQQNWYKDGLARLNGALLAEVERQNLADLAIEVLARHLGAGVGTLYLLNTEGKLKLTGSFALSYSLNFKSEIALGEGIVGQVAKDAKSFSMLLVGQHPLLVETSSSKYAPIEIFGVPVVHDNQIIGVMELGLVRHFKDFEKAFLEEAAHLVGNFIFSQQQQNKIGYLLQDSQEANERLQMQTEELNQTNRQLMIQQQQLEEANQQMEEANQQMEEQQQMLRESKEELTQQYEELQMAQSALNQKAEELTNTSRYKSEFMANMSHELRSPLNAIILLSQQLARNKDNTFTEDKVRLFKIIEDSGNELLRLINDILDLSKVEAGKMELFAETLESKEFMSSVQDLFSLQAEEKGLKLVVEDQFNGALVNDRSRLGQVLRNLLSNALKFTNQGQIAIKSRREAGNLPFVLEVIDTGIGVSKDKKELIFEAFQQADGSTSRQYGGTGLGLSISRELVHLMGGQIELESEVDQGSVFRLRLPLAINAAALPPQPVRPKATKPSDTQGRVLIIEDDLLFAQYLGEKLEGRGFTFVHVSSGKAAFEQLAKSRFDAAVLDLGLPDMNGLDVFAQLRSQKASQHLPIFIVTAQDQTPETQKLDSLGFWTKPLQDRDFDTLVSTLTSKMVTKKHRLLVVEDNTQEAEVVVALASELDLEVLLAKNLEEAEEHLRHHQIDLVLLDLRLQNQDGTELFSRMQTRGVRVPVIVYTGKELSSLEEDRLQAQAKSIIVKTAFSRERLLDELKWALDEPATPLPKPKTGSSLKGKRILIVDDDIKNIFVISSVLVENEAETLHAKNGKEALDLLDNDPLVDLVLMDIMMPIMDGYQAMQAIRQIPKLAHLPVIAVTAKAMREDRKKCLDAGADDYLSKPLDGDLLVGMIKAWVNKSTEPKAHG
ncbi:MAG: hypothetical protein A2527_14390 [Candidatus Lambdaproteobacteria bacterium RIFOXYD2_FULL_50_16]|uniref:histidine kinase n=1 Tax=Candidatus Lambdaproteobacteria bacterium RIFOXYD2_FULL_50_16 TaxID=1817772 RepID=A0A1F6G4R4_9PROT|nr:MAG: hypothetical protein A2527_14390 [Candidatus Lambdaproteobacteria bacterium RIFOXYD2_FULL_50_16]